MKSAPFYLSFLFYFLLFSIITHAQSATGLYIGDYSGIHGAILNPASSRHSKLQWDANLASFHGFAYTNYAFALNSNLFHFLRNVGRFQQLPSDTNVAGIDPNGFYYDFNPDITTTTASFLLDVTGPSVLINLNRFSFGVFSRLRIQGGSHRIPTALSYTRINRTPFGQEIFLEGGKGAAMAWSEYGVSFSSDQLLPFEDISIGINAKYLNGHQGAFVRNLGDLNYTRFTVDSLIVQSPDLELGFTNSMIEDQSRPLQSNGRGFAFDLGASYKMEKGVVNVSILDIGAIKFNNAELYRAVSNETLTFDLDPIRNGSDLRTIIEEIDGQTSENLNVPTVLAGDQITIGMPTRFHADFNYLYKDNIFIGVSIDQRIPLRKLSVEAENVLTIFPRYEKKWWMVSLPISVYEYERVRIGAAFRIAFLTIGSDHVPSLFGRSNFRGSSIYAAIKVSPFWNRNSGKFGSIGRGKDVDCPEP